MKTHKQKLILFSLIVMSFVFTQCIDAKDTVVTKLMEVEAEKLNAECPIQLNEVTRLDSCKVEDKMRFVTYLTVSFIDGGVLNVEDFTRISKPGLVHAVQTNENLDPVRKAGVVFIYSYRDTSGKIFGNIEITPEDYNKPINEGDKASASSLQGEDLTLLLKSTASGFQQSLPLTIDEMTTLENCIFIAPRTLFYEYTLSLKKSDAGEDFASYLKQEVMASMTASKELSDMLSVGVIFSYKYNDKDGVEICTINITEKDFKE